MNIKVGNQAVNGKVSVRVVYDDEDADGMGWLASVEVWVPETDSRSELHANGKKAADDFLRRIVAESAG